MSPSPPSQSARAELRTWQYDDLLLRITANGQDRRVELLISPYGAAEARFHLDLDENAIPALMREIECRIVRTFTLVKPDAGACPSHHLLPSGDQQALTNIGRILFDGLFTGRIREKFLLSLGRAEDSANRGLRIRLLFDLRTPDSALLYALPWELIYDEERRDFLARNPRTPLVRHLQVSRPETDATLPNPLRVLLLVANPIGTEPLAHRDEIDGLTQPQSLASVCGFSTLIRPTLQDLRGHLAEHAVDAIHFIGHARFEDDGRPALLFEDPQQNPVPVSGEALGETLKHLTSIRFVFLNACETAALPRHRGRDPFTGVAAALVLAGVPAVVAMQFPIADRAAITFSHALYSALARRLSLDAAAAEARLSTYLGNEKSWQWAIPSVVLGSHPSVLRAMASPAELLGSDPSSGSGQADPQVRQTPPEILTASTAGAPGGITVGGTGNTIFGGLHLTLGEIDKVEPALRTTLRKRYEQQVANYPEHAQFHFALGLTYLDLGLHDLARASLARASGKGLHEANLLYYLAVATFAGRSPRVLPLKEVKEIESRLDAATRLDDTRAHFFLLWALVKIDYYSTNGLDPGTPTLDTLLARIVELEPERREIQQLRRHVPFSRTADELLSRAGLICSNQGKIDHESS